MGKRMIRWITYNLAFALLPLLAAVTMQMLNGTLTTQFVANSPELLFFALMVSATAMGDISEITTAIGEDIRIRISWSCLFFGAVWSAILYGALLYDSIIGPNSASFQQRLLTLSIFVATLLFIVSTFVEVILARTIDGDSITEVEQ